MIEREIQNGRLGAAERNENRRMCDKNRKNAKRDENRRKCEQSAEKYIKRKLKHLKKQKPSKNKTTKVVVAQKSGFI